MKKNILKLRNFNNLPHLREEFRSPNASWVILFCFNLKIFSLFSVFVLIISAFSFASLSWQNEKITKVYIINNETDKLVVDSVVELKYYLGKVFKLEIVNIGKDNADIKSAITDLEKTKIGKINAVQVIIGIDKNKEKNKELLSAINGLSVDGYMIKASNKQLYIAGKTPDGTANGIYGFLEDYAGVRWFFPFSEDLFTYIPEKDDTSTNIDLSKINTKVESSFLPRLFSGLGGTEGENYRRRNRLDRWRFGLPNLGFNHNLYDIITPDEHGKDHPEYFALISGERRVPLTRSGSSPQPCMSNPDVVEIAYKKTVDYFTKNPDAVTFSLSINDTDKWCLCEQCLRMDKGKRYFRGFEIYSDRYFTFLRKVAEKLQKTHPGKQVGALSYAGTVLPPKYLDKLPDNVVICPTQDTSQHYDEEFKMVDHQILTEWKKKVKHISKYDYYGLGWQVPRYYPHIIDEDLKFIKNDVGVDGFYCEAYPHWANYGPMIYVATKLLWNVNLNVDKLLDEFYHDMFGDGESAKNIKNFYETAERIWSNQRKGFWFEGLGTIDSQLLVYSMDDMDSLKKYIDEALKAADIELVRKRVEFIRNGFLYSYYLYSSDYWVKKVGAEKAASLENVIDWANNYYNDYTQCMNQYKTGMEPYDIYTAPYYRGEELGEMHSELTRDNNDIINAKLNELAKGDKATWEMIYKRIEQPYLKEIASLKSGIIELKNILFDDGFEMTETKNLQEIFEDKPADISYPWLFWKKDINKSINVEIDKNFSYKGKKSVMLYGDTKGAVLQPVETKEGSKFFVSGYVYANKICDADYPQIEVEYRDEKLAQIRTPEFMFNHASFREAGKWGEVDLITFAPPKTKYALLLLLNNSKDPECKVWFDNLKMSYISK